MPKPTHDGPPPPDGQCASKARGRYATPPFLFPQGRHETRGLNPLSGEGAATADRGATQAGQSPLRISGICADAPVAQ